MSKDEQFISVPVPHQYVTQVYELVARLAAGASGTTDAPANGGDPDALTEALVERMYEESEGPHRRLMLYLADYPGQWLGTSEVAKGLGLSSGARSLAGSLGAFGRRAEHRYQGRKPWVSRWNPERNEAEHRMSQEVATWIKGTAS